LTSKSQEADALPAEALGGESQVERRVESQVERRVESQVERRVESQVESQVERRVEERKPKGRVKPWLIPRYGASGETEEVRKCQPRVQNLTSFCLE
jgi:hypothetical protein